MVRLDGSKIAMCWRDGECRTAIVRNLDAILGLSA